MEIVSLKYFFSFTIPISESVVEIRRFERSEDYEWIRGLVTYILFSKTSTTSFQESRLRFFFPGKSRPLLSADWDRSVRASDRDGEYLKIILLSTIFRESKIVSFALPMTVYLSAWKSVFSKLGRFNIIFYGISRQIVEEISVVLKIHSNFNFEINSHLSHFESEWKNARTSSN